MMAGAAGGFNLNWDGSWEVRTQINDFGWSIEFAIPFTTLRLPKLFNLRTDPFELADRTSSNYDMWRAERLFALVPAQAFVGKFLSTFRDYPPRQKPGSFSLDQVLDSLQTGSVRQ